MKTRTLLPTMNYQLKQTKGFYFIFFFCLLMGNMLHAQCPEDIQPSCPIITNAVMDITDNGDGTSNHVIFIDWIQGTANNASLQWDVYYGSIICPEEYDDMGLFPVENCIHVHAGNSAGTITEILNNVPNTEDVFLVAQGRTNASCGGNKCNQTFQQVAPRPVPVKLVRFEGKKIDNHVLLEWTTESEIQNEGFIIEKSNDMSEFFEIDFVEGNGTTSETENYIYRDDSESQSSWYYRLKQVDYDGGFAYSDIIRIRDRSMNDQFEFNIFPNPIKNEVLKLKTNDYLNSSVEIIDNHGNRMFHAKLNIDQIEISTIDWPAGIYNVLLISNAHSHVQRLIKTD